MSAILLGLLQAAFAAFLDAAGRAFVAWRADADRAAAHETIGALGASNETKDVVNEIARQQADINARPGDVLDIARRLRADADAAERGGAGAG